MFIKIKYIIASIFVALSVLLFSFGTDAAAKTERVMFGDVDKNGVVDIRDADLVQRYCALLDELSPAQLKAANVAGDEQVFVSCATVIQMHIADIQKSPLIGKIDPPYDLPDYWNEYLDTKINEIKQLQSSLGDDAFSFIALTDVHEDCNLGKNSGKICEKLMNRCNIKYTLMLGDVVTRGSVAKAEYMENSFENAEKILEPIRNRMLQIKGNHDGAWGYKRPNTYQYQFSNESIYNFIFRKVKSIDGVCFSPENDAYYIDDTGNKVRYIMLNSHHNDELTSGDGSALHNPFRVFRFGQVQIDWLAGTALNTPEDYSVIVASHVPIYPAYYTNWGGEYGENVIVRRLLNAYNKRSRYTDSFAGTHGSDAVSVDFDFSNAKGRVIAAFSGHIHADTAIKSDGITVITHRCDAHEENTDGDPNTTEDDILYNERIKGTITEQSFDVVTVCPSQNVVYCTKIGAGKDRFINIQ